MPRVAGDLAAFRDCLEESWSGVKEDALTAYGNAQDTFDDVDKKCLSALKNLRQQLRTTFVHNEAAYEIARRRQSRDSTALLGFRKAEISRGIGGQVIVVARRKAACFALNDPQAGS